ncbi:efflux RND transporter periplasmic adaptor subunit, partial [Vibrio fluvialis]|nr:efflux RND transporter periplasmic adaptor subunit [Vibrio fluvialis]
IRLSLPDNTPLLVPGMWVKTDFQYSSRDVLLVPSSAVIRRAELSAVYRVVNDARILNPIRLGQTYGDYVEVLSGLEPGDVIATTVLAAEGQ